MPNIPPSTQHPITFPTGETWKDNPRLATGQSLYNLIVKAVPTAFQPTQNNTN